MSDDKAVKAPAYGSAALAITAAVGVIFFAEALTPVKIIGMGLIFAAIAVLNIRRA